MPENDKDHAGVTFPPPFIYLGFLVIGFVIDYFWPVPLLSEPAQYIVGGVVIALGLAFNLPAFIQFRKVGTSVRPDRPATAIITAGPYRYTRNPLYLALAIIYAGIAILGDSIWVLVLLLPTIAIVHFQVILREERYLERKFGEKYLTYKASVRRWI